MQTTTDTLQAVHRKDLVEQTELVYQLADDPDVMVRKELARRIDVMEEYPDVMLDLSNDVQPAVRMQVAMSSAASRYMLDKLMDDEDLEIRRIVARNRNTHGPALHRHVRDEDREVRYAILNHPNAELMTIDMMAKADADEDIKKAAIERLKSKAAEQWR